jgi:hypothetical protein
VRKAVTDMQPTSIRETARIDAIIARLKAKYIKLDPLLASGVAAKGEEAMSEEPMEKKPLRRRARRNAMQRARRARNTSL